MNQYLQMKTAVTISLFLLATNFVFAQFTISGKVTNKKNYSIEYATIVIQKDTSIISTIFTNNLGIYSIKNIQEGNYRIHCSFLKDSLSFTVHITKDTIIPIQMNGPNNTLENITVSSKKPLFERKADRFVFNASKSAFAQGGNLWEMLRHTPLIIANEQSRSVSIAGRQTAVIYINNIKSNLSGDVLYNYLQSVNASNVEKIEIITMPSSEFDASGGASVINIITKKNIIDGTRGSVSVTDEQAFYNTQRTYSYLLYRKGNFGLQANVWLNNMRQRNTFDDSILFNDNIQPIKNSNHQIINHIPKIFYGGSVSADYKINHKQLLNFMFDGSVNWQKHQNTTNSIYSSTSALPDSAINTYIDRKVEGHHYTANISYRYNIDSASKYFIIDGGYFNYFDWNKWRNTSYKNELTIIDNFIAIIPQKINNYSLRGTLFYPVNKKIILTSGFAYSSTNINSDIDFTIWNGTDYTKDNIRSNQFKYNERISAIHASINYELNNKWNTKIGVRAEHTDIDGNEQITLKTINARYTNILPTLFLSYAANNNHQFSYSITQRIKRPQFWELNPGKTYTNPTIYTEGNPFLQPAKIFKQELSYTLKTNYVFLFNHTYIDNYFAQFIVTVPGSKEVKYQHFNYGHAQLMSFVANINNSFFNNMMESNLSLDLSFVQYKGSIPTQQINNQSLTGYLSWNTQFFISKKHKWLGATYFDYNFPQATSSYNQKASYSLDINIKKVFNNGFSFTFFAIDVFKTNIYRYFFNNAASSNSYALYSDTRRLMLMLSYSFGNTKTKKIQQIENSSNDDIKGRTQKKD